MQKRAGLIHMRLFSDPNLCTELNLTTESPCPVKLSPSTTAPSSCSIKLSSSSAILSSCPKKQSSLSTTSSLWSVKQSRLTANSKFNSTTVISNSCSIKPKLNSSNAFRSAVINNSVATLQSSFVSGVYSCASMIRECAKSRVWSVLGILVLVAGAGGSEFPERECCDPVYPPNTATTAAAPVTQPLPPKIAGKTFLLFSWQMFAYY